ncbi:MAG: hypothetical protein ABWZ25_06985 [Chitinophagaceae bacterium]
MKQILMMVLCTAVINGEAQTADQLLQAVKAKLNKVNDYQATGTMKTNVSFITAPIANVIVYYKKPDNLRIKNQSGISFIPKGSVNINLGNIFADSDSFDIIDVGKDASTGFRIIKLLPRDVNSDVVLSTLYIDQATNLVRKTISTTRQNGTYQLDLTYGKYADYGLADKVIFTFNTNDFKLPKGITFDYDDGSEKNPANKAGSNIGKVEIDYSSYIINKGVPDSVFN